MIVSTASGSSDGNVRQSNSLGASCSEMAFGVNYTHKHERSTYSKANKSLLPYLTEICAFFLFVSGHLINKM